MVKLSKIQNDTALEEKGVWTTFYDDEDNPDRPIRLLIARLGSSRYRKTVRRFSKPHRHVLRMETKEAADLLDDIVMRAAADCILLGWENIDDEDGNPIPYSPEKALELFRDEQYRDFYTFVIEFGNSQDHYRQQAKEVAQGN